MPLLKNKRRVLFISFLLVFTVVSAQKRERYEFYKDFPVYAEKLLTQLTYPLAWGNSDIKDFSEWKDTARKKVLECMMTPPPAPKSYDMTVIGEERRNGYTARKIEFNLSDFYRVRAYVLVPDGKGPFPAVNLLHDHGAHLYIGKEKMIRPFDDDSLVIADADKWVADLYEGQFLGDYLARHGYVVFSTDAPMWGERGRKEGVDRNKYDIIAGNMMMYGRDLSAFMTYDDIASTDFLATLPEVDPSRIACAGCSMGAYRAWMLAALSDKIAASAAVCWMVTTDVQMTWKYGRKENGGFANCIPALRQYLDYPHIASLACPKPALFINGTQDKLFKVPGVEKAFKIMHDVWDSQKAGQNLETELWPIQHSCGVKAQQRVLEFFDKHLKK
jgi:dienelactone hydrolase